jgi:hypothetical protein
MTPEQSTNVIATSPPARRGGGPTLIELPCSRCGRRVWLAWADYLDAVASDSPRRQWPYVCRPCRAAEVPPC